MEAVDLLGVDVQSYLILDSPFQDPEMGLHPLM